MSIENLTGSSNNDTLVGGAGADRLNGGDSLFKATPTVPVDKAIDTVLKILETKDTPTPSVADA